MPINLALGDDNSNSNNDLINENETKNINFDNNDINIKDTIINHENNDNFHKFNNNNINHTKQTNNNYTQSPKQLG